MRYKYLIEGIVQGVGFRPTVYKIAKNLNLKGFVLNAGSGVIIEIEGENKDKFIENLKTNLPPLAKIDKITLTKLDLKNYKTFEIKDSLNTSKTTFISPDKAVCEDCLKEMFDKNNKRYLYPFINCTNCGPRYTIIENIPYDRENTSMRVFEMCEDCQKEYTNPLDRRYHAEPISCYKCGPEIRVESGEWGVEKEEIKKVAKFLKEGKIGAIKGLGGFHLVCDATNEKAIQTLRQRKNRPYKPFGLMFKNIDEVKKYCEITEFEEKQITSIEKPIVVVKKKKELKGIADNIDRYGVFLPYTPIHYLLFEYIDFPIVATSANISNEPIIRDFNELKTKLNNVVDFILDYNREIINSCDDSVITCFDDKILTYRLARGYAPKSFNLNKKIKPKILALGANQKNTISLSFDDKVILSPHIGDLLTIDSIEYFDRTINLFKRIYSFEPDILIGDLHPEYESTKWAKNQNLPFYQIQHHYVHILSAMLEHNLKGNFLAFSFDGTGYGDDGNIWGGEVFIANEKGYKRIYHFKYFSLVGGEKGIKNPSLMAVNLLKNIDTNLAQNYKEYNLVKNLKNNFLQTSSIGRIFDIVAFLGRFIDKNEYEGYSGMRIEKYYNKLRVKNGELRMESGELYEIENNEINIDKLIKFVAQNKGNLELISTTFLNTLASIIIEISKKFDLDIILSGGVFQNKTLMQIILKNIDKKVYFNQTTPINDGGISLGQVYWGRNI